MQIARIAVVLLGLSVLKAVAQENILIPCAGAPSEAVLQLPVPLSDWGEIYCTKFRHTLAAKQHWIWSFPGALAPVHLPAQMVREQPKEVRHAAYFRSLELVQLHGEEAEGVAAKINSKLGTRSDSPVSSAYRLTLTNQDEQAHMVLFAITAREVEIGKGHWGIWCDKDCANGSPFMLLKYEKPAK
ncbi:MAG TPA: hypothetical protein PJ986_18660 [Gammaproteobacteria bacterium]|nr:hypothetical protein [Gammaproteobacteria bacterium]